MTQARARPLRLLVTAAMLVVAAVLPIVGRGTASADVPKEPPMPEPSPWPSLGTTPLPGWVADENALPGTAAWRIPASAPRSVKGYANMVSAQAGDEVTLYVSTRAAKFHVEAYRLGYYQGFGGRLVWTSTDIAGVEQAAPTVAPVTNMVEANWTPSTSFTVGTDWTQGEYLLKLVTRSAQNYVPLTVRDDSSHAALVIQGAVTTWQAYNKWGGYSLYVGADGTYASRSRVVSFDRPYQTTGGGMLKDLPMIALAEREGLDITYWTDLDLHERPQLLTNHAALITLGHDEYWSSAMRQGALDARAAGVNIAFFGANADFRHVRFESSPLGTDRRMVCYKSAAEDPLTGVNNAEVTVNWRQKPIPRPESELNGGFYQCNPVSADLVVAESSSWVFAGTELADGDTLPGLIGLEYDRVDGRVRTPMNIQILAHSPLTCRGNPDHSDISYYTTRSQAGVIDFGTQTWMGGLRCFAPVDQVTCIPDVERITLNVLETFDVGPAGVEHPAIPNLERFGIVLSEPLDP